MPVLAAVVLAVAVACASGPGTEDGSPTPVASFSVVTTIYPVWDYIEKHQTGRVVFE